jgi:hypothetical protein
MPMLRALKKADQLANTNPYVAHHVKAPPPTHTAAASNSLASLQSEIQRDASRQAERQIEPGEVESRPEIKTAAEFIGRRLD